MIVSGIDRLNWSQSAFSSACSRGLIRKLIVFVRVSTSPRLRGRPPLPVSGAMFAIGRAAGYGSSIGLGAKEESVSDNDGADPAIGRAFLRANGSGGVGRSPMAYFLSSISAALISLTVWRRISAAYIRGLSALATPCCATSSRVSP